MSRIIASFVAFVMLSVTNMCHAEDRIFLPSEGFSQVKVKNGLGELLFEGEISFPYSPYLHSGIPRDQFPHIYNFENSQSDMQTWEVTEEKSPVFYLEGALRKHFVRNPLISNGRVVVSDPESGHVYISTVTDSDGSFEAAATSIPSDAPDYLKISVEGGVALFKPRSEDNVMAMLVRRDSFSRGSITISMSGTAAYLAAKKQIEYGNIGMSDFYDLYSSNLLAISGGFLLPPGLGAERAAYLNVTDESPIELLPFTTEESVNLALLDGLTIIDIMTASYEDQYEYLRELFGAEMGGWEDYWHKQNLGMLSGRPIEIEVIGESTVDVIIEKRDGTHVSTETLKGNLVDRGDADWPKYKLPKIILGMDERMRLSLNPASNWKPYRWMGCSSYTELTCVVAHNAYEPNILLLKYEPGFEPDVAPESHKIDLSIFDLKGDTFVGKEGVTLFNFHFMVALEAGDKIRGDDNVVYEIIEIELPEVSSPEPGDFKIKVISTE